MGVRKTILSIAALTMAMVLLSGCIGVSSQRKKSAGPVEQSVSSASSESASSVPQSESTSQTAWSFGSSSSASASAVTTQEITAGETITTANMEVTIGYAMFANRVDAREGSSIISYVWQTADEGKILLDVSVYIKNLQQNTFTGTDVLKVTANYDNGYTYDNTIEAIDRAGMLESTDGLMGASVKIDPLETVEVRYVLDLPAEVAENTDAPLFLTIAVEGAKYKYILR